MKEDITNQISDVSCKISNQESYP